MIGDASLNLNDCPNKLLLDEQPLSVCLLSSGLFLDCFCEGLKDVGVVTVCVFFLFAAQGGT